MELGARWCRYEDFEEETVELGFGERVSSFLLDGVLGCEYEEGSGERVREAADGDDSFLHGFEECGLGLGGCTVHFIGEYELGEDGAGLETELAGAAIGSVDFVDNGGADDVGGHEVGRELDAAEGERHGGGEAADQERFADAGDALEEKMAANHDGNEGRFDGGVLADDGFADFGFEGGEGGAELLGLGGEVLWGVGDHGMHDTAELRDGVGTKVLSSNR